MEYSRQVAESRDLQEAGEAGVTASGEGGSGITWPFAFFPDSNGRLGFQQGEL